MSESASLCKACQTNIRTAAKVSRPLEGRNIRDGILIARLGREDGSWSTSTCKFCQLLHSKKLDNLTSQTHREVSIEYALSEEMEAPGLKRIRTTLVPNTFSYELRAFSFLQNYDGVDRKVDPHCGVKDTIVLAAVPSQFQGPLLRQALKSHMWTTGHLIFSNNTEKTSSQFLANVITRQFNPACVLDWLNYCNEHHKTLCQSATEMANIRLIDCHDRVIVPASCHMTYVALSYVWAKVNPFTENGILPADLPRGIKDAMQVTKDLGFRYIWIDKYCIYQNSDQDKGHQIRQMDRIYQGSVLTIIAAAGDENIGFPGIGSTPRTIQPILSLEDSTIISTMPHPHHVIKRSTWMTRGWTLQESILARRRLVFTEDQVYFECDAMNCFESLSAPLDLVHTKTKDRFYSFMRSGLFNGRDEGLKGHIFGLPFGRFDDRSESWGYHFRKYLILATNFTSRNLTNDSDSLNAFAGIMRYFEAAKYPITNLLGIPYVHPSVNPKQQIHLNCAVAGLCWRHIHCWKGASHKVKRRTAFPTWTWAGWSGGISWTDLFTGEEMDLVSLVDDFHCELEDGISMTLPQYTSRSRLGQPPSPLALRFSAWLVPPSMISLDDSTKLTSWMINKFRLELHLSEFEGSPRDFLDSLKIGKLECIFVAKGWYNSYFLIIEQSNSSPRDSWRRIGAAEAIWSEDKNDLRFANEVRFSGAKKALRLI